MASSKLVKMTAGDLIIKLLTLPTSVEVGMFPTTGGLVRLASMDKEGDMDVVLWTDPDFED